MTKLIDLVSITEGLLVEASAWYRRNDGTPAPFKDLDPRLKVWIHRRKIDIRRVEIESARSIIVHNRPVWSKS